MRSFARRSLALAVSAAFALLASPAAFAAPSSATIGAVFDISGSAGAYGASQIQGLQMGQDYVNKHGKVVLNFDIQDAASQKTQAVNLFQRFTTGGAAAIVGPTLSSEAFAADPIAVTAGLPVLGISNTANGVTAMGACVFRDSLTEAAVVPHVLAEVAKRYNVKSAAIIYGNDDAFTKTDYGVAKQAFDDLHIPIVDTETFAKGDVDFSAQLTKIKAAGPGVIFVGALAEEAAHIVSDAHKLQISAKIVGGNGANSPQVFGLSGGASEGTIVGAAWAIGANNPHNLDFVRDYRVKFLKDPDQFAAQAFAGAQIMEAALSAAASGSPKDVCAALGRIKHVQTILGDFSFDGNRDAVGSGVILVVHNGRFIGF
jgi:branched-chain amino acid transport system substrate-binding protein